MTAAPCSSCGHLGHLGQSFFPVAGAGRHTKTARHGEQHFTRVPDPAHQGRAHGVDLTSIARQHPDGEPVSLAAGQGVQRRPAGTGGEQQQPQAEDGGQGRRQWEQGRHQRHHAAAEGAEGRVRRPARAPHVQDLRSPALPALHDRLRPYLLLYMSLHVVPQLQVEQGQVLVSGLPRRRQAHACTRLRGRSDAWGCQTASDKNCRSAT